MSNIATEYNRNESLLHLLDPPPENSHPFRKMCAKFKNRLKKRKRRFSRLRPRLQQKELSENFNKFEFIQQIDYKMFDT